MVHGSCTMHPSEVICILFSAQLFWSDTHDFSLGGVHRFSALCLRVAIAILTCMSVRKRGEKNGRSGNGHSLVDDVRFAIKAYRAAAKVMEGSLTAGISSTEEGGKGPEELERREMCSRHAHDYCHGGDGAARRRQRW